MQPLVPVRQERKDQFVSPLCRDTRAQRAVPVGNDRNNDGFDDLRSGLQFLQTGLVVHRESAVVGRLNLEPVRPHSGPNFASTSSCPC